MELPPAPFSSEISGSPSNDGSSVLLSPNFPPMSFSFDVSGSPSNDSSPVSPSTDLPPVFVFLDICSSFSNDGSSVSFSTDLLAVSSFESPGPFSSDGSSVSFSGPDVPRSMAIEDSPASPTGSGSGSPASDGSAVGFSTDSPTSSLTGKLAAGVLETDFSCSLSRIISSGSFKLPKTSAIAFSKSDSVGSLPGGSGALWAEFSVGRSAESMPNDKSAGSISIKTLGGSISTGALVLSRVPVLFRG
mmetsp:Transcript_20722/g.84225  ORF Transcript_20722/g.84225 Transcript_20722/m.84225 type:complete len:246 (-) Transcript_20722:438-1175(-)